jgi:hypothetical protein
MCRDTVEMSMPIDRAAARIVISWLMILAS